MNYFAGSIADTNTSSNPSAAAPHPSKYEYRRGDGSSEHSCIANGVRKHDNITELIKRTTLMSIHKSLSAVIE